MCAECSAEGPRLTIDPGEGKRRLLTMSRRYSLPSCRGRCHASIWSTSAHIFILPRDPPLNNRTLLTTAVLGVVNTFSARE
jgi:hypothetical protein